MNRLAAVFAIVGALTVGAIISQTVQAQTTFSDEQLYRIRQNCVTAQTTLSQLHVSDAGLRNNRGALYENISTKLMAPLNSRITLSRLEGLKLTATTLEYDRQLDIFRESYKQYESAMARTLKVKCTEQPVEFYENVVATREKREKLHEDTRTLITLLQAYKTEFETFSKDFEEHAQ